MCNNAKAQPACTLVLLSAWLWNAHKAVVVMILVLYPSNSNGTGSRCTTMGPTPIGQYSRSKSVPNTSAVYSCLLLLNALARYRVTACNY